MNLPHCPSSCRPSGCTWSPRCPLWTCCTRPSTTDHGPAPARQTSACISRLWSADVVARCPASSCRFCCQNRTWTFPKIGWSTAIHRRSVESAAANSFLHFNENSCETEITSNKHDRQTNTLLHMSRLSAGQRDGRRCQADDVGIFRGWVKTTVLILDVYWTKVHEIWDRCRESS